MHLSCCDLDLSYLGAGHVLRGASLEIAAGAKVALLGRNGAGKSSLLHCLLGLLKPQKGQVLVDGVPLDYSKQSLRRHRQRVGLLLQNPDDQLLAPLVRDDVALGPRNLGLPEPEVEQRVAEALALFDLEALADSATHHLSVGQKKRVALAGLLTMNPEVVLLDEPSAGLDPHGVQSLCEFLDILARRGVSLLLSTHDLDFAYQWAHQLALLEGGAILAQAEPEQIFSRFAETSGLPILYELGQLLSLASGEPSTRNRAQLMDKLQVFLMRSGNTENSLSKIAGQKE